MPYSAEQWRPTFVTRFVQGFATALLTSRVDTDHGEGYVKTLGTPAGPHPLACELLGSLAADWLGAATFDFSLIDIDVPDVIPLTNGSYPSAGTAFISRAEDGGFTWGGDSQTLASVRDQRAFGQLVVLDTWLRNCDRHAPDKSRVNRNNVFLIQRLEPTRLELMAMDFTHALTCGEPLDKSIGRIERIRDQKVYGFFDEFKPYVSKEMISASCDRLSTFDTATAQSFLDRVPADWRVDRSIKLSIQKFLVERAHFLADHLIEILWPRSLELFGGYERA